MVNYENNRDRFGSLGCGRLPDSGLTYGLQVIEGLHHAGVEFRALAEDFDTATSTGKLQLSMVLAFSEWWRNSIRERSVAG